MKKNDKRPPLLKFVQWFFPKLETVLPFFAHRYFIKIFFTPLRYPTPEKERIAEGHAEKFSFTVFNKKIQGYGWGQGENYVLLVHGWAGRCTQMRRFIKPLISEGFKVIGFDGPAHGNSTGNQTNIIEFEQALKLLNQKYGVPHAIIAHSFGGSASLYAAMQGLPINKLIMIATPTIGDEVIKTYLRAVNGSWETGEFFKHYMTRKYGKSFDEFSALHFVRHLPSAIDLLLVYDKDDKEVPMKNAEELIKAYPHALLIKTKGLGHTRILKDDEVIRRCVTFVRDRTSGK